MKKLGWEQFDITRFKQGFVSWAIDPPREIVGCAVYDADELEDEEALPNWMCRLPEFTATVPQEDRPKWVIVQMFRDRHDRPTPKLWDGHGFLPPTFPHKTYTTLGRAAAALSRLGFPGWEKVFITKESHIPKETI